MYVCLCSGKVGPTVWDDVSDIYVWCVETLLKEFCGGVEFSAVLWVSFFVSR